MKIEQINIAEKEAKRFLERVRAVKQEYSEYKDSMLCGSKHTGALRRASMDLTRALSEMRKP